ncbi:hypothetical protein B0T24DRAFT_666547 [Lasiosphaeria ovina]|uniref:Uncharacterized protein n=1 Tax=Lasiosphaeria ovina TaxID=92902 RepID=A0AAE0KAJ9_9PEZI|nr:hypothetical protein B0T24DRAFT_666547 [Lasiosphaeria ovina]
MDSGVATPWNSREKDSSSEEASHQAQGSKFARKDLSCRRSLAGPKVTKQEWQLGSNGPVESSVSRVLGHTVVGGGVLVVSLFCFPAGHTRQDDNREKRSATERSKQKTVKWQGSEVDQGCFGSQGENPLSYGRQPCRARLIETPGQATPRDRRRIRYKHQTKLQARYCYPYVQYSRQGPSCRAAASRDAAGAEIRD